MRGDGNRVFWPGYRGWHRRRAVLPGGDSLYSARLFPEGMQIRVLPEEPNINGT